jgi:SMP-30/gluconolaconase/LRE-like protein
MNPMRAAARVTVAAVLFSAGVFLFRISAATADLDLNPVALGVFGSGELAVLDSRQGLFVLNPDSEAGRLLVGGFGVFAPWDVGVDRMEGGGENVFLTMNPRQSSSLKPRLARFDTLGNKTGEWGLPRGYTNLTGLAIDSKGGIAYVAGTRPPEIYRLALTRSPRPNATLTWFAGVRGAKTLGAMVLDLKRGRLLIADPYQGIIYSMDLIRKSSDVFVEKLGRPDALILDSATDRLLVADSLGKRILTVNLKENNPKPKYFARGRGFSEPRGLAFGPEGSLWVADEEAEAIFLISEDGRSILRVIDLD